MSDDTDCDDVDDGVDVQDDDDDGVDDGYVDDDADDADDEDDDVDVDDNDDEDDDNNYDGHHDDDNVYFYDDDASTIKLANSVNSVLDFILSNTDDDLKSNIKSNIKQEETYLVVNQATGNKIEPFISNVVTLRVGNLIKTFESFKFKF